MSVLTQKTRILLAAGLLAFAAVSTVQAGEVKNLMKDMKQAMQAAMASNNMQDFSKQFARLQDDSRRASQQNWKADPALYKEGMQKLQIQLDAVAVQVQANNLPAAKAALAQTNPIKKRYHNYLN
ncbi:cytochrome b562 [uncultured Aquitalea sp.]|uniref:cytochrome b562 n=1 Tax=uncultured Aquitalea sp. TaxID=540272 RepID=UPI0025FA23E1|nr:cytochrome b562 [uncultured Aquitalea sp.]